MTRTCIRSTSCSGWPRYHGIVLLNGGGFAAPDWSVRISFANLENHVYDDIGRATRAIARADTARLMRPTKARMAMAAGKKRA